MKYVEKKWQTYSFLPEPAAAFARLDLIAIADVGTFY